MVRVEAFRYGALAHREFLRSYKVSPDVKRLLIVGNYFACARDGGLTSAQSVVECTSVATQRV